MLSRLAQTIGLIPKPRRAAVSSILSCDRWPAVVYAIGDVHGRLDLLIALERQIVADAQAFPGERWMILLGDVVDRGPQSAAVLDHLSAPPPEGFVRHGVAGNHELMMLRCLEGGRHHGWLHHGGFETLLSYGLSAERIEDGRDDPARMRRLIDSHIPEEHRTFLRALPPAMRLPGWTFVHMPPPSPDAPLRAGDRRIAADLGLLGETFTEGRTVHGHKIIDRPATDGMHVNIDTGAYLTGRLTALRLVGPNAVDLLQTSGNGIVPDAKRPTEE